MSKTPWLIAMLLCGACQTPIIQSTSATPAVRVQAVPPMSPSPTPNCQPVSGVSLEIRPVSNTAVGLVASGLQPGEVPTVFYSTEISGIGSRRGEAWGFANGADQHGNFSLELTGLVPLEGQSSARWDIRLVHRRGVACVQVTLP